MDKKLVFFSIVFILVLYISYPLLFPIIFGGILAVLFWPMLKRLEKFGISVPIGALILTLVITLGILVPVSMLIYMGAKTGIQQLQVLKEMPRPEGNIVDLFIHSPFIFKLMEKISQWYPVSTSEVLDLFQDLSKALALRAGEYFKNFLGQLPGLGIGMMVVVLSVYFFLIDGWKLMVFIKKNSFLNPVQTEHLFETLESVCKSVVMASVISGLAQAFFEMLICWLAGVHHLFVIGMLVFLSSFLPIVGASLITISIAIHQMFLKNITAGVILLIAAMIVLLMDNLIRPWILKGAANLNPFLGFVAALGGLQTLGFIGVFLGPILAGLLVEMIRVFSEKTEMENSTYPDSG